MITKYQTVGITYDESKVKLASILFDKVYCPIKTLRIPEELLLPFQIRKDDIDFVSQSLSNDKKSLELILEEFVNPHIKENFQVPKKIDLDAMYKTRDETKTQFFNALILEISKRMTSGNTLGIPLFNESILNYNFQPNNNNTVFEKVEVEIINNPIIDCSSLEWSHILDAKKDKDFVKKVKRFSIFINKNYTGKDLSYITDDLNMQLQDYREVCEKHGIKLKDETFKSLSNSKSLFGTLGITLLSMICEMPQYAIATASIGAILELANLKINLKNFQDQYESSINKSPIALIYEIEKMQKSNCG